MNGGGVGPASENVEYGVDMPSPVGWILFRGNHHVAGALLPELCLSRAQELNQVPGTEYWYVNATTHTSGNNFGRVLQVFSQ